VIGVDTSTAWHGLVPCICVFVEFLACEPTRWFYPTRVVYPWDMDDVEEERRVGGDGEMKTERERMIWTDIERAWMMASAGEL
jgi:hypothetical protein